MIFSELVFFLAVWPGYTVALRKNWGGNKDGISDELRRVFSQLEWNGARIPLAQKRWNQNETIDFFAHLALNLKLSSQISRGILKFVKKNPQCVVRPDNTGKNGKSFYDFHTQKYSVHLITPHHFRVYSLHALFVEGILFFTSERAWKEFFFTFLLLPRLFGNDSSSEGAREIPEHPRSW